MDLFCKRTLTFLWVSADIGLTELFSFFFKTTLLVGNICSLLLPGAFLNYCYFKKTKTSKNKKTKPCTEISSVIQILEAGTKGELGMPKDRFVCGFMCMVFLLSKWLGNWVLPFKEYFSSLLWSFISGLWLCWGGYLFAVLWWGKLLTVKSFDIQQMKSQCRRELHREESTVVVCSKGQHRRN